MVDFAFEDRSDRRSAGKKHEDGFKDESLLKPKFQIGKTYMTPAAESAVSAEEMMAALFRHVMGDWGDLDLEDKHANEIALREESRLLSSYATAAGVKFWIITEADRSTTTVLLPEDY